MVRSCLFTQHFYLEVALPPRQYEFSKYIQTLSYSILHIPQSLGCFTGTNQQTRCLLVYWLETHTLYFKHDVQKDNWQNTGLWQNVFTF